jgi:hypothetical protein
MFELVVMDIVTVCIITCPAASPGVATDCEMIRSDLFLPLIFCISALATEMKNITHIAAIKIPICEDARLINTLLIEMETPFFQV